MPATLRRSALFVPATLPRRRSSRCGRSGRRLPMGRQDSHAGRRQAQRDAVPAARQKEPCRCVFTLTPYISRAITRGHLLRASRLCVRAVDVRGRGNSEGEFDAFAAGSERRSRRRRMARQQPYCNGKVTMWGGSYAGYDQWATAKEFPPHLATIVPVASPYPGVDFPMRSNIFYPYDMQWLTFTSGHAAQDRLRRQRVLDREVPRVLLKRTRRFRSSTDRRQSVADLPGLARASVAGRVLGQLQPDRRSSTRSSTFRS